MLWFNHERFEGLVGGLLTTALVGMNERSGAASDPSSVFDLAAALREAFIATVARDTLETSIWAHEGRHAIDQQVFKIKDSPELEYRAKLSEIALAKTPRLSGSILSPIGGPTAHGLANKRVLEGLIAWMTRHAADIPGFDPGTPAALQLDKLTPAQLRAAAQSLDPIAKRP